MAHDDPRLAALVGDSPCMRRARAALAALIDHPRRPVLLLGEPGTGKELATRLLHRARPATGPLTVWSAARDALAQVDALSGARGLLSDGGTLLITDAHALDPVAQARIGSALTTRTGGLRGRCTAGPPRVLLALDPRALPRFYPWYLPDDLAAVYLPPLHERLEDLPALCAHLLRQERGVDGLPLRLRPAALDALARPWPGNVDDLACALRLLVERHRRPAYAAVPGASVAALSDAQVARALAARAEGETLARAAARLGLTPSDGTDAAEPPVGWRRLPPAPRPLPRPARLTSEGLAAAATAALVFPPALLAAARLLGW
ncbi:MAG: sigma 54-interacting transcriptional regulator [Planctomycetes bacterium]|nr:sigma 54-interacting transcriptional regulator [Planctomycetota bacterium]